LEFSGSRERLNNRIQRKRNTWTSKLFKSKRQINIGNVTVNLGLQRIVSLNRAISLANPLDLRIKKRSLKIVLRVVHHPH
jgi:hypothetical protein